MTGPTLYQQPPSSEPDGQAAACAKGSELEKHLNMLIKTSKTEQGQCVIVTASPWACPESPNRPTGLMCDDMQTVHGSRGLVVRRLASVLPGSQLYPCNDMSPGHDQMHHASVRRAHLQTDAPLSVHPEIAEDARRLADSGAQVLFMAARLAS